MTICNRIYSGTYAIRTAPCEREAGHLGFCHFEALGSDRSSAVLVIGALLLLALGMLADGAAAWGMP